MDGMQDNANITKPIDARRGQVRTRSGPASYIDTGGPGRPALFVHGVGSQQLPVAARDRPA